MEHKQVYLDAFLRGAVFSEHQPPLVLRNINLNKTQYEVLDGWQRISALRELYSITSNLEVPQIRDPQNAAAYAKFLCPSQPNIDPYSHVDWSDSFTKEELISFKSHGMDLDAPIGEYCCLAYELHCAFVDLTMDGLVIQGLEDLDNEEQQRTAAELYIKAQQGQLLPSV